MADDSKDALCGRVRYLKDNQGLSLRQIARELGISRDKATALYNGTFRYRLPRAFILAPYRDLIAEWFHQIPSLKAVQVWKRLVERRVAVSRRAVEEYTETFRRLKKPKVHWPLTFLPGEEAQVDWFFLTHPTHRRPPHGLCSDERDADGLALRQPEVRGHQTATPHL